MMTGPDMSGETRAEDDLFDDRHKSFVEIIAEGGTLREAAAKLETTTTTLKRWLRENDALRAHYIRAREAQADSFADEIIETARNDKLDPQARRVRIDALKWAAGKRKPKVYGDKLELSGDPEAPVLGKETSPQDLARAMLVIVAKAEQQG